MLKMKPIDYDLLQLFVYTNDSISIRCNNIAIINMFMNYLKDMSEDFTVFSNNWIIIRNTNVKLLAYIIRICNDNGIEFNVY